MSNKQQYVVSIAVDGPSFTGVALVKDKGPAHLIGKLTFPGGKLEQGESLSQCASRELNEETGVFVAPDAWDHLATIEYPDRIVHMMGTITPKVFLAKTQESEKVHQLSLRHHIEYARRQPAQYASDFVDICKLMVEHYQLQGQEQFL